MAKLKYQAIADLEVGEVYTVTRADLSLSRAPDPFASVRVTARHYSLAFDRRYTTHQLRDAIEVKREA